MELQDAIQYDVETCTDFEFVGRGLAQHQRGSQRYRPLRTLGWSLHGKCQNNLRSNDLKGNYCRSYRRPLR
jgi:hypothetical protein